MKAIIFIFIGLFFYGIFYEYNALYPKGFLPAEETDAELTKKAESNTTISNTTNTTK